nr:MAG TPA: hypothetical protein [Caudoviricetes sp.]
MQIAAVRPHARRREGERHERDSYRPRHIEHEARGNGRAVADDGGNSCQELNPVDAVRHDASFSSVVAVRVIGTPAAVRRSKSERVQHTFPRMRLEMLACRIPQAAPSAVCERPVARMYRVTSLVTMSLKLLMVTVLISFGIVCKREEFVKCVQTVTDYADVE